MSSSLQKRRWWTRWTPPFTIAEMLRPPAAVQRRGGRTQYAARTPDQGIGVPCDHVGSVRRRLRTKNGQGTFMTSSKKMCSYRGLLLLISIILVARARKSEEEGGCCCAVELVILHAYVDGQRIDQQSIDLEPRPSPWNRSLTFSRLHTPRKKNDKTITS